MRYLLLIATLLAAPAYGQLGIFRSATNSRVSQQNYYNGPYAWGRWCNNPRCGMCNGIEAHNRAKAATVTATASPSSDYTYRTEYRTETYRVKICNGRSCHYETRTRQVPVRVRVETETKVAAVSTPIEESFVPTPMPVVKAMLGIVAPRADDIVYDLGCGDGRIIEHAIREYGAKGVGIEINTKTYQLARKRLGLLPGNRRWTLVNEDVTTIPLDGADIVTIYLYPPTIEKLKLDTLRPGTRVISYSHDIPGVETTVEKCSIDGVDHTFYTYTVPSATMSTRAVSFDWALK